MTNKQLIYDIIRESGSISRIDIHRRYGIRKATVTRITERLLKENLICFSGRESLPKGRTPELLAVNDSAFHVLGIHAASNFLYGGIVSSGGCPRSYSQAVFPLKLTRESFLELLEKFIRKILAEAERSNIIISAIALALPGEVDHKNGFLVQAAVILPGLVEVPCKNFIEKKFKLPVIVDHDAAMITYAEFLWGQGKTVSNLGALFVGHGIGGRFIINGELFRGARNRAGELGHIPLRRDGPVCKCGLRGCVESLASIPVIEKNYSGDVPFAEIAARAETGDKKAVSVLIGAAGYLGEALAIIFDIIDIDLMVVCGDIIKAEKIIRRPLIESVMKNSHSKQPPNKEFLKFSRFGPEVGVLGAAAAGSGKVFSKLGIII
ncbi:MAG: ROK family transcriptional regulator [Victivallales bacterium]|nr:ROK family transcriptional regulator [Victivallales bacterium]